MHKEQAGRADGTRATRARVSVIVPAREASGTLLTSVESALAQDPREVVVAVGPSADGTAALAAALTATDARVHVVENPSGATGAALNAALAASSGDVVARLDAHAVLPAGYLARAVQVLDETGAANVGGVQDPVGMTPFEQAVAAAMRSRLGTGGATFRHGRVAGPVDTVYLGVFRRDALEAVGGFDPGLLRNQDYELNIRLRAAGETVWFDPHLRVEYRPRGSLGSLARQYYDYGRWKREVLRRHPESVKLRQLVPPVATLANAAGLVVGARWRPALVLPALYFGAVLAECARLVGRGGDVGIALRMLSTFPVMHSTWGWGFLVGPPSKQ